MSYIPEKNKKAAGLSLIFTAFGLIIILISHNLSYSWLLQLLGVVLITLGIQFSVRFFLSDFKYVIEDLSDGNSDLLVYKTQGKKTIKVCHISLSKCIGISNSGDKKPQKCKIYNYTQNIGASSESIFFSDNDDVIEIVIEADGGFISELQKRIGDGDGSTLFAM